LEWRESDNCVYMTGPAVEVFNGNWIVEESEIMLDTLLAGAEAPVFTLKPGFRPRLIKVIQRARSGIRASFGILISISSFR